MTLRDLSQEDRMFTRALVANPLIQFIEENDINSIEDFNEYYYTMDKIDERDLLHFMVEIYFDEMNNITETNS